jgi:exopolysaccharide biosynthesis polyprenyl glycosylphosphotransferase
MATSEFIEKTPKAGYKDKSATALGGNQRRSASQEVLTTAGKMAIDVLAILSALCLASIFRFDGATIPDPATQAGWLGIALPMHPGYLLFFITTLLLLNRREGLYGALQRTTTLHELRRTVQACLTAGLLLCGGMYVMHNTNISRAMIAYLIAISTIFLCVLRVYWRYSLYRRYERGLDSKNVHIIGPNQIGNMIRRRIAGNNYLGRTFKGYVENQPGTAMDETRELVVGDLCQLERLVRQHFIDEIIITEHCNTKTVIDLFEQAQELDVELLVVPGCYEDLTPESPIQYLADFPVVSLHRRNSRAVAHLFKRAWDFGVSSFLIVALLPTLLAIALLVKLESSGPVFYKSNRVGKKGRVFQCIKFRTMVANAEQLQASLVHRNERDGVLFKIKDDPRVTRFGRVLRKFSLDELPQLFNVLKGDMSLVGPRPPLASEVQRYDFPHFRRLEVLPGLTGLWQVRARQDPSFERYIGLDLAYVENWTFWLDLKILALTAEVVLRGTGS